MHRWDYSLPNTNTLTYLPEKVKRKASKLKTKKERQTRKTKGTSGLNKSQQKLHDNKNVVHNSKIEYYKTPSELKTRSTKKVRKKSQPPKKRKEINHRSSKQNTLYTIADGLSRFRTRDPRFA